MRLRQEKLAVFRSLWFNQSSEAPELHHLSGRQKSELLLWLDRSGLALYFLQRLQHASALKCLPQDVQDSLQNKLQANRRRTALLIEQLAEVVSLLEARGIPYAVLKGFSLTPEFCCDPVLRHQTDIDLLLRREDVSAASAALESRGYARIPSAFDEEIIFSTPLLETPSIQQDIYAPRERKVELHLSLWDDFPGIALGRANIGLGRVFVHQVMGVQFCALSPEETFLMQCLHMFRHFLGGWVRPSWVYELAAFLNGSGQRRDFHSGFVELVPSTSVAHVCGLSLAMAATAFRAPVPLLFQRELVGKMPEQTLRWVETYGQRFLLSDIAGTKIGLLAERAFAADDKQWRARVVSRILPFRGRPRLGSVNLASPPARWIHRGHEVAHILRRLRFHVASGIELAWEALRARRTLHSSAGDQS